MCSCVGLELVLGIGFREWVPIRNIIGGAAGAHIPMTFGLQLSACETTVSAVTFVFPPKKNRENLPTATARTLSGLRPLA